MDQSAKQVAVNRCSCGGRGFRLGFCVGRL
jgi:hypothetical protein